MTTQALTKPGLLSRLRAAFEDEPCAPFVPRCSNPCCGQPYRRVEFIPEHPQSAHLPSGYVPDCDCEPEEWEIGE